MNKDKNIIAMNELNAEFAHLKDGSHMRWKGLIPDGVDMVAIHPNSYASAKNLAMWEAHVEAMVIPEVIEPAPVIEPTLQEVIEGIDYDAMTKKELDEYALSRHGVELDRRATKEAMIAQLKGLI